MLKTLIYFTEAVVRKVHNNQAEVQKIIEKWLIRAKDKVTCSKTVTQCSNNEHT